jgi:hypothetical protein
LLISLVVGGHCAEVPAHHGGHALVGNAVAAVATELAITN